MWPNFEMLGPPYNFWRNRAIRLKLGTEIEDGPLRRVNHKVTPKSAWPGSCDPVSKCWDPLLTFWTNGAVRFKFGMDIVDGPSLSMDYKTTLKWAWPESRDLISKFWVPLITCERIEQSASNLAYRNGGRTPSCVWTTK